MRELRHHPCFCLLWARCFLRSPAGAALARSSEGRISVFVKGHNSDAPVDVSADQIEVQDRADRAIFAGNVHVKQAELTLDTAAPDRRLHRWVAARRGSSRSDASTRPAE